MGFIPSCMPTSATKEPACHLYQIADMTRRSAVDDAAQLQHDSEWRWPPASSETPSLVGLVRIKEYASRPDHEQVSFGDL